MHVSPLNVRVRLDERRPPLDRRPVRVVRQSHPVECLQAVAVVDVVAPQLNAEGDALFALHQVHKCRLDNEALAAIARNLDHGHLVVGLPDVAVLEYLRQDGARLLV